MASIAVWATYSLDPPELMHALAAFVASDKICAFSVGSLINSMIRSLSAFSFSSCNFLRSLCGCDNLKKFKKYDKKTYSSDILFTLDTLLKNSSSSVESSYNFESLVSIPNYFLIAALVYFICSFSYSLNLNPVPDLFLL